MKSNFLSTSLCSIYKGSNLINMDFPKFRFFWQIYEFSIYSASAVSIFGGYRDLCRCSILVSFVAGGAGRTAAAHQFWPGIARGRGARLSFWILFGSAQLRGREHSLAVALDDQKPHEFIGFSMFVVKDIVFAFLFSRVNAPA